MDFHPGYALVLVLLVIFFRWYGLGHWRRRRLEKHWQRGQEAFQHGDFDAAEAAFRTCVRTVPTVAALRRALGGVLSHQRKFKEAEEQLRFAAELEPRNPIGHMDLGFFFAVAVPDRAEHAIDAFAEAVACDPAMRDKLAQEPRLDPLRRHERFRDLIEGGGPPA